MEELMHNEMMWEDVYQLWKQSSNYFPKALTDPLAAERVFVKYERKGCYFYGYDWLEKEEAEARKTLIKDNPVEFFCFTTPSNKGTIQTAEMLIESQDQEERAAIWIASTAKELESFESNRELWHYAYALQTAACSFLKDRYYLWHHAMRKLVPCLMIPPSVRESMICKDVSSVMGLIQMNTILLRSSWTILLYSSLEKEKEPESSLRIRYK